MEEEARSCDAAKAFSYATQPPHVRGNILLSTRGLPHHGTKKTRIRIENSHLQEVQNPLAK